MRHYLKNKTTVQTRVEEAAQVGRILASYVQSPGFHAQYWEGAGEALACTPVNSSIWMVEAQDQMFKVKLIMSSTLA